MKLISEIKRVVSQYFETEYWYRFRKISENSRALSYLNSTWEGDYDLLNILLLKLEHMFYNNKKYSDIPYLYIDGTFFRQAKDKKDIAFFHKYIGKYFFGSSPLCNDYSWRYIRQEYWTDRTSDIISKKKTKKCSYLNYTNYVYIGVDDFTNKPVNDIIKEPKIVYYYYYDSNLYDGHGYNSGTGLAYSYDNKTMHDFAYIPSCYNMDMINKIVKEKTGSTIFSKEIIDLAIDAVPVTPEDYKNLSEEALANLRGQKLVLMDILNARRTIKKLLKLRPSSQTYEKDKEELYTKLMVCLKKADTWWN